MLRLLCVGNYVRAKLATFRDAKVFTLTNEYASIRLED